MTLGQLLKWTAGVAVALILLMFLAAGGFYYYEFPGYCKRLLARARAPEVQHVLQSWVSANWSGTRVSPESTLLGDGVVPGVRWLPAKFDGSLVGMGPKAHVRLLGVEAGDILDDAIAPHVQAIYFTERSRYGLLVELPDRETFQPPDWFEVTPVAGGVAVFCEKESHGS